MYNISCIVIHVQYSMYYLPDGFHESFLDINIAFGKDALLNRERQDINMKVIKYLLWT